MDTQASIENVLGYTIYPLNSQLGGDRAVSLRFPSSQLLCQCSSEVQPHRMVKPYNESRIMWYNNLIITVTNNESVFKKKDARF